MTIPSIIDIDPTRSPTMADKEVTAKEAAKIAIQYLRDITEYMDRITVEEVDRDEKGTWEITLGLNSARGMGIGIGIHPDQYKRVDVDKNGTPLRIKIRKFK